MVKPVLIDLNLDEFHYHPFIIIISMKRCDESCNTIEYSIVSICIPNKMEDLNLNLLEMVKGINETKTLAKHISIEWKCEFDDRKSNFRQKWNHDQCQYKKANSTSHI